MTADVHASYDDALTVAVDAHGLTLSDVQRATLWAHAVAVTEANQQFNLTRVANGADFAVKHHADALAVLRWCQRSRAVIERVLDVGTGAGIPALPLAVSNPGWQIIAIDGTAKKTRFLAEFVQTLPLPNLDAVHARAEHWHSGIRFDLVLFKAVGSLTRCLELAQTHVAREGRVAVFKTADIVGTESEDGRRTAKRLGYAQPDVFCYELPLGLERLSRALWIFRKIGS